MITSVNLCGIPFQSSTDSTRLQMASKQIQQTLTHKNCEIPYVIDENYDKISKYSELGVYFAKDDGHVVFKNDDIIIVTYKNLGIEIHEVPIIRKTHSVYASELRNILNTGDYFKKNDVLFEYDCFNGGIPCWGYNVFSAYDVWFGFNHEDSIVVSESFAQKAKLNMCEKIYLPIYEFTILDPIYNDPDNWKYFPAVNQPIHKSILCQHFIPKTSDTELPNITNMKNKVIQLLRSMSVSDYVKINQKCGLQQFKKEVVQTKLRNAYISGFKIHKINQNRVLLDKNLQNTLDFLYKKYNNFIVDTYKELTSHFTDKFSRQILKRFYIYKENDESKLNIEGINIKECIYLLEFEIRSEDTSVIGDKFTNRFAGKGVCSLIMPDDLRPIALETNKPIDLSFNPFSVYSRMNIGQVIDGAIAKTVMCCDNFIRNNPDQVKETINWLNNNIIKYIYENDHYYNRVNELEQKLEDEDFKQHFLNDIYQKNLYIEAPSFTHIDLINLNKNWINPNESVLIKKKAIDYIKDRLKLKNDFTITSDIVRKNIFCVPMYVNKLYKLTKTTMNSRDFGLVKDITQQPVRGRAQGGGSRLGQMEVEGLLAGGCEKSVKELLTVKSDHNEEKRKLTSQVIETGDYNMDSNIESIGRTKKVVSTILTFLKE